MAQPASKREDPRGIFRSHHGFLRAFADLIAGQSSAGLSPDLRRIGETLVSAIPSAAPASVGVDHVALRECLGRAWGTEHLLAASRAFASDDELRRLSNTWGVVQAYYASHAATQALVLAEGRQRPTSHPDTCRQAVELWVTRRFALAPWSLAVGSAAHREADSVGVFNGPADRVLRPVHAWETPNGHNCWDIAAVALRTTREKEGVAAARRKASADKLRKRKKDWDDEQGRREKAKRARQVEPVWPSTAQLTPEERAQAERRVRPYTMLDYLYRLRVRANYSDAAVFVDGPSTPGESRAVSGALGTIVTATLLAHEVRIARKVGMDCFLGIATQWLDSSGTRAHDFGLAARMALLREVCG